MRSKLIVVQQDSSRKYEVELSKDETRIGRSPLHSDLVLDGDRVSRRHAIVRREGQTYQLVDLESANGTFVNGQRVKQHQLRNKDSVTVGNFTLVYAETDTLPAIQYANKPAAGSTILLRDPREVGLGALSGEVRPSSISGEVAKEDVESLRRKAETLSRLYELSQILRSVFSLADIFKKVSEMIFRTTKADRFVVLLKDPSTGELAPFATELRGGHATEAGETITISRTVMDRVVTDRLSLLSIDAQSDERLGQAMSLVIQQVHSVMCAPLLAKDDVLGVIYVDCQHKMIFTPDNLDMLNALAAQTSMAVDNAITHDQLLKEALARATYGRFMPKHVVEQILADPKALSLGGTNQVVTTLFSDIRGFTTLAEGQPPEVVVRLLNEYFSEMTPIVFDNGGLLDKYIGDGLMALYGVPYQSEDAAFNAVTAAIAMQRRMIGLNDELKEKGLPEIAIGIGINTGTVTIGYIGSEQRTDYTVIGDAVNLSARLEKQAAPWQILISRSTMDELGGRFSVKAVGEIKVKGKTVPVQVYEILWKEAVRLAPPTHV